MRRIASPLLLALWVGCGSADATSSEGVPAFYGASGAGTPDDSGPNSCVDSDGDGFGRHCADGPDCNDEDDTVFEDCPCTAKREGCACDPADAPLECKLSAEQLPQDNTLCTTGLHYCRDGAWTECIGIAAIAP